MAELEEPRLTAPQREQVKSAAQAVAQAFQALHRTPQRLNANATTNHVERLYILPLTASIDYLCEPSHFPILKPFVDDAFMANEINFRRLTTYLTALRAHESKTLRLPFLTRIHGDAHSRNIMLDPELRAAKFVDVETMGGEQDYLMDYALLLEDVAFYRVVSAGDRREHAHKGERKVRVAGDLSGEIRNSLRYPYFPQGNEAAILFQQELLRQIKQFAESMEDENWQLRLWLAIASSLILLLDRQTHSKRLGAQRSQDGERVIIAYAETTRLLNELVTVLEARGRVTLPDLPFSGKQVNLRDNETPTLIRQVKELFAQLPDITIRNDQVPAWLDYFAPNAAKPFAQFRTSQKSGDAAVHFFVPAQFLSDPSHLLGYSTAEDPRVVLTKINVQAIPPLRDLIACAYHWSREQPPV